MVRFFVFFQAEDGIRDLVRSRGLGDVYKRQEESRAMLMGVLDNKPGSARDIVILNTGAALYAALSLIHI